MKKGLVLGLTLILGLGAIVGCASNNKTTNVAECSEISKEEMEVIKVLKDIKSSIDKQNQLEETKSKQEVVRLLQELYKVKEPKRINQEEN